MLRRFPAEEQSRVIFTVAGSSSAFLNSPAVLVAAALLLGICSPAAADEKPITYEDHVAAILKKNGSSGISVARGDRIAGAGGVDCWDGNTLCALCPIARDRRLLAD